MESSLHLLLMTRSHKPNAEDGRLVLLVPPSTTPPGTTRFSPSTW